MKIPYKINTVLFALKQSLLSPKQNVTEEIITNTIDF